MLRNCLGSVMLSEAKNLAEGFLAPTRPGLGMTPIFLAQLETQVHGHEFLKAHQDG